MDISSYINMLQGQGMGPAANLSQPSIGTQDVLNRMGNLSTSFRHMVNTVDRRGYGSAESRAVSWASSTAAQDSAGKVGLPPGPARLSPLYSRSSESKSENVVTPEIYWEIARTLHKRMIGAQSLNATISATANGAKQSQRNIDMLIRGQ